jgi:muramoyltetrapeptide carboxypeptidase
MSHLSLKKGDIVQIIAPAGKTAHPEEDLLKIQKFLTQWGLIARWSTDIMGTHLLFPDLANTDEKRFSDLKNAILDPAVKAIWCIRGGYGCARLIPYLRNQINFIPAPKLFIGFSDITLLHLYFQKKWGWFTLHASHAAAIAKGKTTAKDNELLRQICFGEVEQVELDKLEPLNKIAQQKNGIQALVVGGNLTLLTRSLGSDFAFDMKDKIVFIEEVEEPYRKIDGMLKQLIETLNKPVAVIFGTMITKNKNQRKMIEVALNDFASLMDFYHIPVLRTKKIGHGKYNQPLPLLTQGTLFLGQKAKLLSIAI